MELVVSNFDSHTTAADLKQMFGKYGKVENVFVWIDHFSNHIHNNYAYVDMPHCREARKAVRKLNGRLWDGLELSVDEAN
jgi:RNA recognition motif-containing protein